MLYNTACPDCRGSTVISVVNTEYFSDILTAAKITELQNNTPLWPTEVLLRSEYRGGDNLETFWCQGDKRAKVIVTLQIYYRLSVGLVFWLKWGASVAECLALIGHVVLLLRMYEQKFYLITDISYSHSGFFSGHSGRFCVVSRVFPDVSKKPLAQRHSAFSQKILILIVWILLLCLKLFANNYC